MTITHPELLLKSIRRAAERLRAESGKYSRPRSACNRCNRRRGEDLNGTMVELQGLAEYLPDEARAEVEFSDAHPAA